MVIGVARSAAAAEPLSADGADRFLLVEPGGSAAFASPADAAAGLLELAEHGGSAAFALPAEAAAGKLELAVRSDRFVRFRPGGPSALASLTEVATGEVALGRFEYFMQSARLAGGIRSKAFFKATREPGDQFRNRHRWAPMM